MSNAPQEIVQQLTFDNGRKSLSEYFYLSVLDQCTNVAHLTEGGFYSPLAISRVLGCTVAQVVTAIEWLTRQGYVRLNLNSQVIGLSSKGEQNVYSRNGKEKAR